MLFPIDNLHEAIETAKGFFNKSKDRQAMTGQSTTPFIKLTETEKEDSDI